MKREARSASPVYLWQRLGAAHWLARPARDWEAILLVVSSAKSTLKHTFPNLVKSESRLLEPLGNYFLISSFAVLYIYFVLHQSFVLCLQYRKSSPYHGQLACLRQCFWILRRAIHTSRCAKIWASILMRTAILIFGKFTQYQYRPFVLSSRLLVAMMHQWGDPLETVVSRFTRGAKGTMGFRKRCFHNLVARWRDKPCLCSILLCSLMKQQVHLFFHKFKVSPSLTDFLIWWNYIPNKLESLISWYENHVLHVSLILWCPSIPSISCFESDWHCSTAVISNSD